MESLLDALDLEPKCLIYKKNNLLHKNTVIIKIQYSYIQYSYIEFYQLINIKCEIDSTMWRVGGGGGRPHSTQYTVHKSLYFPSHTPGHLQG